MEHTRRLTFLDDKQAALITAEQITVYEVRTGLRIVDPKVWDITWREERADLDGHPHFMIKEIHEQPRVLRRLAAERAIDAQALATRILSADTVDLIGCGSPAHAAKTGEHLFSNIARRQVNAVVGSEFSYPPNFVTARSLVVGLTPAA